MKFVLNEYNHSVSNEELLEDVKRVANILGDVYISNTLYKKHGKYGNTIFVTRFDSWMNVLKQLGLRTERNSKEMERISDEDMISDLLSISKQLNKNVVTSTEYNTYGKYSFFTIKVRFGSWSKFVEKAGLKQTGFIGRVDDEDLLKEIERIWIELGRQPTTTDIKKGISKYDLNTFSRRFGGWRGALQYFVDWVNSEEETKTRTVNIVEEIDAEENKNITDEKEIKTKRTSRNINLRLRFRVLLKDNFKCCLCGDSPAKNPSIELHVDHIKPWSKGGETVIENLQTLCSKCNLGKGNIFEEF